MDSAIGRSGLLLRTVLEIWWPGSPGHFILPPLEDREVCLPGHPASFPLSLPHSWLAENKVGDIQMAVGAFEPGAGGEGKGCRQGMLFQTKKEMLAPKERKGSSFLLLVVAFL